MRKILIYICILTLIFPYIAIASVKRTADFRVEDIIEIDEFSRKQDITEYIDISDYRDVEIIDCYVDNGKAKAEIVDNEIRLKLRDGDYSYTRDKVTKKYMEEFKDLPLDNENSRTIVIEPEKEVENISSVSGDFESAKIDTDGNIVIKVKKSALGIPGYDKRSVITDTIDVKIDESNRNESVSSEDYIFEYPIVKGTIPRIKNNTAFCNGEKLNSTDLKVIANDVDFFVEFDNGMPKLNETKNEYTYPYYWIDRFSNGTFKPYYPNEAYNTPKVRFNGKGDWLPGSKEPDELTFIVEKNKDWMDYSGYELDGKKYVYVDTKSNKNPFSKGYIILNSRSRIFSGQWFNTEKLTMTIDDDEIIYEPEGKLYSCGEFVPNTKNWGEMMPAKDWEIQESFYNPYIDGYDTYVKHFKFFYGPEKKVTFGGYYTYPYSCTVEYDHYKPADLYSGSIVYTYKDDQDKEGYYYNGWITIEHTVTKIVDDFPPEAPYNLKYNKELGLITWREAKDDYTPKEDMRYQVEYQSDNIWKRIGNLDKGILSLKYNNDGYFRVRAIDEMNQYSPWVYSVNDLLELNGKVIPHNIKAGDSIEILANTLSHDEIVSVQAIQEELGIDTYLYEINKEKSKFLELTFQPYGNVKSDGHYINAKNSIYAYDKDDYIMMGKYANRAFMEEDDEFLELDMPDIVNEEKEIPITKDFTVIIPCNNYLNVPTGFFQYDNKFFNLQTMNYLYGYNERLEKKELIIGVENYIYKTKVEWGNLCEMRPLLTINSFKYNEKNQPQYINIWLDKDELKLPVTMTITTDERNMSQINVYLGKKLKHSYEVPFEDIDKNIRGINYYGIRKRMRRFIKMGAGYTFPDKNKIVLEWAEILDRFRDVTGLRWLGCKINEEDSWFQDYAEEYNNYPTTRDVNRILFVDKSLTVDSIDKYNQLIKNSNVPIKSFDDESVYGDEVMEISTDFRSNIINTPVIAKEGLYWITIIAKTNNGNEARMLLPLNIGEEKEEKEKAEEELPYEEELLDNTSQLKSTYIGRFHYEDSNPKISPLLESKTTKNKTEGFISAGETLSLKLLTRNIEFLTIDIEGDESIKTFDDLTKRFIYDEPLARGNVVEGLSKIKERYSFPVTIYPIQTNEDGSKVFDYKYVIPYKTKQTLHSWSSLRKLGLAGDEIDTSRLLERIESPYKIVIKNNGEIIKKISFDVFERWDNVLNRDLSKYLI